MSGISFKIQAPPRPSSSNNYNGGSSSGQGPTASSSGRRPTSFNLSRTASTRTTDQSAQGSSDSEDDEPDGRRGRDKKRTRLLDDGDEEVVEFGASGAKSKHAKAPTGPLVIAALPNKDWRKAAEDLRANRGAGTGTGTGTGRRRKEMYLPEASNGSMSMQQSSGSRSTAGAKDVDAINTEEVVGGLSVGAAPTRPGLTSSGGTEEAVEQVRQEIDAVVGVTTPSLASTTLDTDSPMSAVQPSAPSLPPPVPQATAMTDEQRALRELLGHDAAAGEEADQGPEAIYSATDNRGGPIDEAEAFKRDVDTRPDEASLEDYARVPVGQFGLAMLRGMGWQPGQAASRSGRGAIEAHVPSARPSLLGIGAKPMAESLGTEVGAKGAKGGKSAPPRMSKRDEMKFVPLVKKEREGSARAEASEAQRRQIDSGSSSRRTSRSPPPPNHGSTASSRHASRRGSPSRRDYSDRDERDRDRDRRDRRDRDRDSNRRRRDERERDYDSDSHRHRRREDEPVSTTSTSSSYYRSSRDDESSRSYRSRGDDGRAAGGTGTSSSSSRRDDRRREGGERDDRQDRRERERR